METVLITEGTTKIEAPNPKGFRTVAGDYAPSLTEVFYNPELEFSRDISVSVVQTLAKKSRDVWACDPLAGIGVRGIRYAKEVDGVRRSVVNDRSQEASELIKRNVKTNGLDALVEARSSDANIVLRENQGRFNFVDLDPFGSPAPYLDAACGAMSRRGILALTATDTAPLCGTHAKTCLRRYGAVPLKTEYCHELGVRILAGFAQRVGGLHELALTPILAHATLHYFRIYLSASRGAHRADEVIENIGFISQCCSCARRTATRGLAPKLPTQCECGGELAHAGPLWLGRLIDKQFTLEVVQDLSARNFKSKHQELTLLSRCVEEADGPATFYDLNEVARLAGVAPPKIAEVISALRLRGHFASRTHFSDTGFRTDAPVEEIDEAIKAP